MPRASAGFDIYISEFGENQNNTYLYRYNKATNLQPMKIFTYLKPFLLALFIGILVSACSDDKGKSTAPNTLTWMSNDADRKVQEPIIYASYAREDNSGGNIYPNEYFEIKTASFYLKLKIPQQYIDNGKHKWSEARSYSVIWKGSKPEFFEYEDINKNSTAQDPARIVGGNFRILPMGRDKYEIDMNINISHYEYGQQLPSVNVLKLYFNGAMIHDPSINEWVDPGGELRR